LLKMLAVETRGVIHGIMGNGTNGIVIGPEPFNEGAQGNAETEAAFARSGDSA